MLMGLYAFLFPNVNDVFVYVQKIIHYSRLLSNSFKGKDHIYLDIDLE